MEENAKYTNKSWHNCLTVMQKHTDPVSLKDYNYIPLFWLAYYIQY